MDAIDLHVRWIVAAPIYLLAYAVACGAFWWMARRRGMASGTTARIMGAGLIGGLAGANIVQFLVTGLPGKTIEGGIIGGWIAVVVVKRYLDVNRSTGDLFALAIPAGEMVGRIACFIGGCCYGKAVTALPWSVHDHGGFRHPAQLYLSIGAAACFTLLLLIERRRWLPQDSLFAVGGMLFCVDRFVVEFFREGSPFAGGLTVGQVGCCVGFAVFAALFARRTRRVMLSEPAAC